MKSFSGFLSGLARIVLLVAALSGIARAQGTIGAIEGKVTTSTGQNLQGAIVRLIGTDYRAETGRDGTFSMRSVVPGQYRIEATYLGLDPKSDAVLVNAGVTANITIAIGSDVVQLDAVRVEADAAGQARAVNQQRVADAMVNVTSEELFGETTDNNIAKALQRIPGISANSDGGTEVPRYVNIRGFDATLNSVQLNGSRLPTTNDGTSGISAPARGFALDDLPANSITNIEIVKAPTPDMDGDAVGGIVNLITKSAFDREGRSIDFNVGMDYISLREEWVPHVDLGYSDLVMDGRLGVRFDLSYFEGNEGFDNVDYDWLPLAPGIGFNQGYGLTDGYTFAHEDTEYNNYFIDRTRIGFTASLDFKLSDTSSLHFRPAYTTEDRSEDDRRYHKIMDNDHGRTASAPPAGTAIGAYYTGTRGRAIATSATTGVYSTYQNISRTAGNTTLLPNGNGRGSVGYRQSLNEIEPEFYSVDFGGEHVIGWRAADVKWNVFYSDASRPQTSESVRFDRNAMQWGYTRADILRPVYEPVGGPNPLAVPTRGDADYFINPSSSNIVRSIRDTQETVVQTKFDITIPLLDRNGIKGTFKTGVKYRAMEREHDRQFFNYSLSSFATYDFASYLKESDYTVTDFAMGYHPDTARIISEATSGNAAYTRDVSAARLAQNLASDYTATEDSYETYIMSVLDIGANLQLIPGVRLEHTKFSADTPVYDVRNPGTANTAATMEHRENDYTQVLPGFHLRYESSNNLVFRTAYTHTYARPSFRELIAVTNYDEVNNTITTGNPDLEPYGSVNWDFSVEYYGAKAAYVQAALFHKKVTGQVLELGETITGVSEFNDIAINPAETYTVTTFSNQHESVNMGIELVGRYKFVDLPAPFDGLMVDGSVTYTDSDGRYADRPGEKLPTYGGSEWLYFASVGYQKGRIAALISYRYRSEYLEGLENVDRQNRAFGLGPDVGDDWWGTEEYVNLETSYRLTPNFKVYCNITNLFEFTNYSTQSRFELDYPEDSYWHKRRFSIGFKGNF